MFGITGAIDLIRRITPKAVIRGVQLSTGALLIAGGVKFMIGTSSFQVLQKAAEPHLAVQSIGPIPVGLLIGILGGIVTLLLLDSRRFPAGLVVVAGGFAVGLALGARMPPEGLGLHLPRWLPFGFPSEADFTGAQPAAHGDPGHLAGLRRHPVGRGLNRNAPLEFGNRTVGGGQGHQPVGHQGVDAHQGGGHVDELPGVPELAFRAVVNGQVDRPARFAAADHAARVGAVGRHRLAGIEAHVRQKTLVAPDQPAGSQWRPGDAVEVQDRGFGFSVLAVNFQHRIPAYFSTSPPRNPSSPNSRVRCGRNPLAGSGSPDSRRAPRCPRPAGG